MTELHLSPLVMLLFQMIVIVGLSRGMGSVARRLGQPTVIAEVLAGIMLGPSLLGWLSPQFQAALFPAGGMPLLSGISQIGLVFFMFLVGLEFDPKLLEGRGKASVLVSIASIVTPFMMGLGLAWKLEPVLSEPTVPFRSFALFLGVAMSITAFPVLARILSEQRVMNTRVGAITLACAAVGDVTAWCILAFVVSVARSEGATGALWTTGLAALYVVAMLTVVRPFLGRLSRHSREGVTPNLVAICFLLLMISAAVTELIGIHALFGSFLIGTILPRETGLGHALTEKVEDFVTVALLPLFFAYSGLRTEIGLLSDTTAWLQCALIIAVACIGKFGGSFVAARLTGLGWREAGALGILMNTRGLIELIVLNIGLDLKVISPLMFTMMVLMALVTTFITSPLLQWIYPPAQMRLDEEARNLPPQPPTPVPQSTVMLCISDPAIGPGMATLGAALQRGKKQELLALTLVPSERPSAYMRGDVEEPQQNPQEAALERATELGVQLRTLMHLSADPAADICKEAEAQRSELVLLGFHRPMIARSLMGGVVREVLAKAPTDVGILVDRGLERVERVLVAAPEQDRAVRALALRLANGGAKVVALRVAEDGTLDGVITKKLAAGDPGEALLREAAEGYDLVIVGVTEVWDLDPSGSPFHRERLVDACPTSLLAVKGR